jgi:hypothetical protein
MATASWSVSELVDLLEPDPWRHKNPFSDELVKCHNVLFDAATSRQEKAASLNIWLSEHQPCLFGRMESRQGRLPVCLLTENDLARSDQEIRALIARERRNWKRLALNGNTHGFILLVVSKRIATARLNESLYRLASRLCELYVGDGTVDQILHDDVLLEIPLDNCVEVRKWKVGINFFSSQGDGRWWQDHRVPGGLAFSMNSVGHMARQRAELMLAKNQQMAQKCSDIPRDRLVFFALPTAMKTIGPPSNGSTRGTWLAEHGSFDEDKEPPPYMERSRHFGDMATFSENRYRGHYHTDQSIPSVYFNDGLWRKEELPVRDDLFFTYMHSKADDDYLSMGLGEVFENPTGKDSSDDETRNEI